MQNQFPDQTAIFQVPYQQFFEQGLWILKNKKAERKSNAILLQYKKIVIMCFDFK
jgi:hypothetical protein